MLSKTLEGTYFKCFCRATDIQQIKIRMVEFLIDNIYAVFGGHVYRLVFQWVLIVPH